MGKELLRLHRGTAGFRRQMGTIDNSFVLHGLIKQFVNEGKLLYITFIDFTRAFDYVVRENMAKIN